MTARVGAPDTDADIEVRGYLDDNPPVSFIMVAGAGSGKTTSLVNALSHLSRSKADLLRRKGQKVACITYTEVAEKEIWADVQESSLFHVSTIHSFLWTVIRGFQSDIQAWVRSRLDEKIAEAQERYDKPRTRGATRSRLLQEIEGFNATKQQMEGLKRFNYGVGSDYGHGILGHDDIIRMVPALLVSKPLLRILVAQRFPFVFVDESQDTSPAVVDALRAVSQHLPDVFCVGFFGDPMQKIYTTGIGNVPEHSGWKVVNKAENFRCPGAVLQVINNIRSDGDGLVQTPAAVVSGNGSGKGSARCFVVPRSGDRSETLKSVRRWIAAVDSDPLWNSDSSEADVRVLVIVHRMAANRLGFPDLYSALNDNDAPSSFKEGLLDGSAWIVRPLLSFVLPVWDAVNNEDDFSVMNLLRRYCPLLHPAGVSGIDVAITLERLRTDIAELCEMLNSASRSTVGDVLRFVAGRDLMIFDEQLTAALAATLDTEDGETSASMSAVRAFLVVPAVQLQGYRTYIERESPFSTQQGIKGAQFKRVLAVIDEEEGSHIQFSYSKYFKLSPLSDTDDDNIRQGKDNVIDRTRRLFYVCCSRATHALAVVLFAEDLQRTKECVLSSGIFPFEDVCELSDVDLNVPGDAAS